MYISKDVLKYILILRRELIINKLIKRLIKDGINIKKIKNAYKKGYPLILYKNKIKKLSEKEKEYASERIRKKMIKKINNIKLFNKNGELIDSTKYVEKICYIQRILSEILIHIFRTKNEKIEELKELNINIKKIKFSLYLEYYKIFYLKKECLRSIKKDINVLYPNTFLNSKISLAMYDIRREKI